MGTSLSNKKVSLIEVIFYCKSTSVPTASVGPIGRKRHLRIALMNLQYRSDVNVEGISCHFCAKRLTLSNEFVEKLANDQASRADYDFHQKIAPNMALGLSFTV